jgi:hypothetical protein
LRHSWVVTNDVDEVRWDNAGLFFLKASTIPEAEKGDASMKQRKMLSILASPVSQDIQEIGP